MAMSTYKKHTGKITHFLNTISEAQAHFDRIDRENQKRLSSEGYMRGCEEIQTLFIGDICSFYSIAEVEAERAIFKSAVGTGHTTQLVLHIFGMTERSRLLKTIKEPHFM